MIKPPIIGQAPMNESDIERAEQAAQRLGYEQTAYSSTSGLWGLFCLQENPEKLPLTSPRRYHPPYVKGCFIKTEEFGLLFVADLDDLNFHDLADAERKEHKI